MNITINNNEYRVKVIIGITGEVSRRQNGFGLRWRQLGYVPVGPN